MNMLRHMLTQITIKRCPFRCQSGEETCYLVRVMKNVTVDAKT